MKRLNCWLLGTLLAIAFVSGASAQTQSFFRDQAITMKVATKLQFNKQLWRTGIQVETKDGVVTLSGNVESKELIAEAARLTAAVDGVKSVRNQLRVGPQQTAVDNAM
jgi:hyperosmotically inducible protein